MSIEELRKAVREAVEQTSLRQVAAEIPGVSHGTIASFIGEKGEASDKTIIRLRSWLTARRSGGLFRYSAWDPARLLDILDRESRAAENRSEQGKLEAAAAKERATAARLAEENARLFRFGIFSAGPESEEIARQGEEAVFGPDGIEDSPDKTQPSPPPPPPDLPRRTPRNGR